MDKDLRQKLETAASNLQNQDDGKRVPALVRKIGGILTFLMVAAFTIFGVYAGIFYSSQGPQPGANAALLTGIGLFLGLMLGTIVGVGLRKLLYKIFSGK